MEDAILERLPDGKDDRTRLVTAVLERLPDGEEAAFWETLPADEGARVQLLGELMSKLPERLLGLVLQPVRVIGLDKERAQLLAALANRLGGEVRKAALVDALEAARAITGERARAELLAELANQLSGEAARPRSARHWRHARHPRRLSATRSSTSGPCVCPSGWPARHSRLRGRSAMTGTELLC